MDVLTRRYSVKEGVDPLPRIRDTELLYLINESMDKHACNMLETQMASLCYRVDKILGKGDM